MSTDISNQDDKKTVEESLEELKVKTEELIIRIKKRSQKIIN